MSSQQVFSVGAAAADATDAVVPGKGISGQSVCVTLGVRVCQRAHWDGTMTARTVAPDLQPLQR